MSRVSGPTDDIVNCQMLCKTRNDSGLGHK